MKKIALITGGSGDIGTAIAKEFGENGYIVAIQYYRNQAEAEEAVNQLKTVGITAAPFYCDIRNEESVNSMVTKIEAELGTISALVNNAGISQIKLFDEITLADWDEMLAVNLTGAFLVTKRVIKKMIREKNGSIINISSMWGQVGASCEVHYSASKGGMIAMTKALAKEVAPSGIRVNCICPGVIDTKMNSHLTDCEMAELKEEIPLGVLGTGKDIAEAALFLAEKGRFITGQIIGVNGGMII